MPCRQDYILCRERLLNDSRTADADLFNFWWPDVALPQLSLYRSAVLFCHCSCQLGVPCMRFCIIAGQDFPADSQLIE